MEVMMVVVMIGWISVYFKGFAARDTAERENHHTTNFTLNPGDTRFTPPLEKDEQVVVWADLNSPTYIWQYPLHLFLHTEEVDSMDQCGSGGGGGGSGDTLSTIVNQNKGHKAACSISSHCDIRVQLSYDMYNATERLMTCCCATGEMWLGQTKDGSAVVNELGVRSLKIQMDSQMVNVTEMATSYHHHHHNNNNTNTHNTKNNTNNNNTNTPAVDVVVSSLSLLLRARRSGRWCVGVSVLCDPMVPLCGNVTVFLQEVSQRRTHPVAHTRKKRSVWFGVSCLKVEWCQLALGVIVKLSLTVLVSLISYINLRRLDHRTHVLKI
ncbi:hypothetical protein Pmani_015628 [Petrolisthes manimaculis]|uniref:Uncharacterized protein n=1 Tax=Petrolisthes manimaculis TaxID=1843537 RepID=A0AAE1U7H4_9EUCA|nr:hypothetical protein Pmani_015628 [Petrolisthes manimaculis]